MNHADKTTVDEVNTTDVVHTQTQREESLS